MSSEVFSSAYMQAQRKAQLARQMRKNIANAAESIRKISASINNANRILQEQGSAISREIAGKGTLSAIDARLEAAITGQADISGFTKEDISKLADLVKKNTELLQTQGTIHSDEDKAPNTVSVGLDNFESAETEESTGFVRTEVSVESITVTPEKRKIIQLGEILIEAKSQKDIEYTELLIVSYGILDEPVWSSSDVEHKTNTQRKIERIDSDKNMTVFEKIDKIKKLISEYVKFKTPIPSDVDAEQIVSTYKVLCQRLGKTFNGNIPINQMSTEIEKMTEELIAIEEKAYISNAIVEAFEEEGIVLDDVKSAKTTQVFYLEESDDCEVIISNVDGGFLMETVGIYEQGTTITSDDQKEMKKNAKKVCDKYKQVIARLAEKGVIIDIASEDDPEAYLKICEESSDTFVRRKKEKKDAEGKKNERRERRRKKELKTFD